MIANLKERTINFPHHQKSQSGYSLAQSRANNRADETFAVDFEWRFSAVDEMLNTMWQVFVYGTLKPDESAYPYYCEPYVSHARPALMQGELFHLPEGYPALTVGDRWIAGALLTFQDATAIAHIDQFEDYNPDGPAEQNLYERRQRPVFDSARQPLGTAWVYLMQPHLVKALGGIPVPSGIWSNNSFPQPEFETKILPE